MKSVFFGDLFIIAISCCPILFCFSCFFEKSVLKIFYLKRFKEIILSMSENRQVVLKYCP